MVKKIKRFIRDIKGSVLGFTFKVGSIFIVIIVVIDLIREKYYQGVDWPGVLVEAHGMIFDILFFGLIIGIFSYQLERRRESDRTALEKQRIKEKEESIIQGYKDQIEDYRGWHGEEAAFRVSGILRRLEKKGIFLENLSNLNLSNVPLELLSNSNGDLKGISMKKVNLQGLDFSNYDLTGADFSGSTLLGAKFKNAKLNKSKFTEAILSGSDFSESEIRYGNFEDARIENAHFENARLIHSNLRNAKLFSSECEGCQFYHSTLTGAFFKNATLTGVTFDGSTIAMVNFDRASLKNANLIKVNFVEEGEFREANFNLAILTGATFLMAQKSEIVTMLKPSQIEGVTWY